MCAGIDSCLLENLDLLISLFGVAATCGTIFGTIIGVILINSRS